MNSNRILALDIGSKRTGLAISDEGGSFSFPLKTLQAQNKKHWVGQLATIIEENGVGKIVVGLPLNQDGEVGKDAQNIRQYIALLQERIQLPVIEWDERFTTVQAERSLITADVSRKKRKTVVDQVAATIILQNYLDSLRFQESSPCETH